MKNGKRKLENAVISKNIDSWKPMKIHFLASEYN